MYPENTTVNIDIVKRYVLTFKTAHQPQKLEKKKLFKMNKYGDKNIFVDRYVYYALGVPNEVKKITNDIPYVYQNVESIVI